MNNIKTVSVSLVVASIVALSGCGSDSVSTVVDGLSGGDASSTGTEGVTPSSSYDCSYDLVHPGTPTVTTSLSATGELTCSQEAGYPELKFKDGVNEISVTQLVSTQVVDSDAGVATVTYDLQAGTEHLVGSHPKYGKVDCVTRYDVELPLNVYSADNLNAFDFYNYQKLSTTCPDWVDNEDDYNPTRMSMTAETTITDSSGKTSTISSYLHY